MKSTWLSFAVSDSRQYSYINVTLGVFTPIGQYERFRNRG